MYSFDTRVGFSHTDNKRNMTISSMIDAFQDCSCFQAEQLGIGFDYLEPNNLVWILNAWQLEIKQYPVFYDKIKIATYPYDFKGFFGYRNFFIENEKGDKIVTANSVWTLMDWEKKCPAHMPQHIKDTYILEERLLMDYQSRKIKLPNEEEAVIIKNEPLEIKKYHLDSNQHVNNGQYIRIALENIEPDFRCAKLRAEYRKQAVLGDIIIPIIYRNNNQYTIALCDEEESPYAVIDVR